MSGGDKTVGLIGLGGLGLAMAKHLITADFEVIGYRRSAMDDFIAAGGNPAKSASDVAEGADLVLTVLPTGPAVGEVLAEIATVARPGLVVAEMSTLPISEKKRLAEIVAASGAIMLDGAVSGTPQMVAAGRGGVFISGDAAAAERARPALEATVAKVTYTGDVGTASALKMIANLLVPVHVLAGAEAFAIAERAGLDRALVHEAISGTPASSAMFEMRGKMMVDRDYDAPGSLAGFTKGVDMVAQLGEELGGRYPLLATTRAAFHAAIKAGYGEDDQSVVFEWLMDRKPGE